MNRFFAPLRLPISVDLFPRLPYYVKTLLVSSLRTAIALLLGPEAYFLSRGRVGIAVSIFLIKIGFALADHDHTGRMWMRYLALLAEAIQVLVSLVAGYRLARTTPAVELVEQVDFVDESGAVISSYESKLADRGL